MLLILSGHSDATIASKNLLVLLLSWELFLPKHEYHYHRLPHVAVSPGLVAAGPGYSAARGASFPQLLFSSG